MGIITHLHSIKARQLKSEAHRTGKALINRLAEDRGAKFKICQYLPNDPPTRKQLIAADYDLDRFKCGAPAQHKSPYCREHHYFCYQPKPLTDEEALLF